MFLLCKETLTFLAKSSVSSFSIVIDGGVSTEADELLEIKSPVVDEDEVPHKGSKSPKK